MYLQRLIRLIKFNYQNIMFCSSDSVNMPLISVVVPLYNEERYILECLLSVEKQSYRNWECIIVNDCSTDGSVKIVEQFMKTKPRLKLFHHATNRGLPATRNTGLKETSGKYITFLDADDYLLMHSLFRRVLILEKNANDPSIAGSYCAIMVGPESGYPRYLWLAQLFRVRGSWIDFLKSSGECPFNVHAPMLKTELVKKFSGFNETMRYGAEDWDLWYRMMRNGYKFAPSFSFGAVYRQKGGSMVRAMPIQHSREALRLIDDAEKPLNQDAILPDSPYIYKNPLSFYTLDSKKAKRLIGYITTGYLLGDETGTEQLLKQLTVGSAHYLRTQFDIDETIRIALRRYYCVLARNIACTNEENNQIHQISKLIYSRIGSQHLDRTSTGEVLCAKRSMNLIKRLREVHTKEGMQGVLFGTLKMICGTRYIDDQLNGAKVSFRKQKRPLDVSPLYLALEERSTPLPDRGKIQSFYNKHKGERCFIIGNGPSLNMLNITKLNKEYTFGVNGIFYKTKETGFRPYYYVVEDSDVMKDNVKEINAYEIEGQKLFPTVYKNIVTNTTNVTFFRMNRGFYEKTSPNYGIPRFSADCAERIFCGQSVTIISLQLAFYMGFEQVYLIGMDFNYTIPQSAIVKGVKIESTEDDPNHFHPDYFGKGKKWSDPQLDRVLVNYKMANFIYECADRKIYNATVGGRLELFERVDYNSLF